MNIRLPFIKQAIALLLLPCSCLADIAAQNSFDANVQYIDYSRFHSTSSATGPSEPIIWDSASAQWIDFSDIVLSGPATLTFSLCYGLQFGDDGRIDKLASRILNPTGMIRDRMSYGIGEDETLVLDLNRSGRAEIITRIDAGTPDARLRIETNDASGAPLEILPDFDPFTIPGSSLELVVTHGFETIDVTALKGFAIDMAPDNLTVLNDLRVSAYTQREPIPVTEVGVYDLGGRGKVELTGDGALLWMPKHGGYAPLIVYLDDTRVVWAKDAEVGYQVFENSSQEHLNVEGQIAFENDRIAFQSEMGDIRGISLSSPWRSSADGGVSDESGQPIFEPDTPYKLDDPIHGPEQTDALLDAVSAYIPLVNTIRIDINAKTIDDANFQGFLREAAARGYKLILNYTDANFGNRTAAGREDFFLNNVSYLDTSQEIDLENGRSEGDRITATAIDAWGHASTEYDPLDYLIDGWRHILDFVHQDGNETLRDSIFAYELVNEPGSAYFARRAQEMHWYGEDMAELITAHEGPLGWGDSRIMVNVANPGSGLIRELATAPGFGEWSGLDLIARAAGNRLIWSAHKRGGMELFQDLDPLGDRFYKIASNDFVVTETAFDADREGDTPEQQLALSQLYGVPAFEDVPAWAGWTLLDVIRNPQPEFYYNARSQGEWHENGIGSLWWAPTHIDSSLLGQIGSEVSRDGTGVEGVAKEERDSLAFALEMWSRAMLTDDSGRCGGDDHVQISDNPVEIGPQAAAVPPRIAFGCDGDDTIIGTDTSELEGLPRVNDSPNVRDDEGIVVPDQNFGGDKAYGGPGDDLLSLLGGDDFGFGQHGDDQIDGGSGNDVLLGGAGFDRIEGGDGDDVLEGGLDDDILVGGAGRDLIKGDSGDDRLSGGPGIDFFYFDATGDGRDLILDFERGVDRVFIGSQELDVSTQVGSYEYADGAALIAFVDLTNWSAESGVWALGVPTAGPSSCHHSAECVGTVLDGNYPADIGSRWVSPVMHLPSIPEGNRLDLRIWEWFSYAGDDWCQVQVRQQDRDTGVWDEWQNLGQRYGGVSGDWRERRLDLSPYAGKRVRIAFQHGVDHNSIVSTGWYLDGFALSEVYPVTVPWRLRPGMNLVAMLYDPLNGQLQDRLSDIGTAPIIERVYALDADTGRYLELVPDAADNPAMTLLGGEGIAVYATEAVDEFRTSLGCPSWRLRLGINMVGALCVAPQLGAYELMSELGGPAVVASVSMLESGSGRFMTAAFTEAGDVAGENFMIENGRGYLIHMRESVGEFRLW